jgi:CRP/FNR family cyclic AMP-dependent transcriptional regulator
MRHRDTTSTATLLRNMPGLQGCSDRDVAELSRLVDVADVEAGHVLTREGAAGRESFVIVEGEAEVTVGGQLVATLGAGQFVGEMAMIDFKPRTATVTAITPVRLLVLSVRNFRAFIDHPVIGRVLTTALAERLRRLDVASDTAEVR